MSGEVVLSLGETVGLEGTVIQVDATPMFVDGDGLIFLLSETHRAVTVHIPARERLCMARGLEVFHTLRTGDSVRVVGTATGPRSVTVCVDEDHLLEKLGRNGG